VNLSDLIGLVVVLLIFGLMVFFAAQGRQRPRIYLRDIPAFSRLRKGIGLAVEAGQRLHVSLGHGGVNGFQGASTLLGLSLLRRIARAASRYRDGSTGSARGGERGTREST